MERHHLDTSRWIVAHAAAEDVRVLAAALGVRYRELPNRTFNHTESIALADREGVIKVTMTDLQPVQPAFLTTIQATVANR